MVVLLPPRAFLQVVGLETTIFSCAGRMLGDAGDLLELPVDDVEWKTVDKKKRCSVSFLERPHQRSSWCASPRNSVAVAQEVMGGRGLTPAQCVAKKKNVYRRKARYGQPCTTRRGGAVVLRG